MRKLMLGLAAVALALPACKSDEPVAKTAQRGDRPMDQAQLARSTSVPENQRSNLDLYAVVQNPMPTGIALSHDGRVFVNYPRWGDPVRYSVTELIGDKAVPYPGEEINKLSETSPSDHFYSVQSVVVDPKNRLWVVDTGSINFQPVKPGGAKLLAYDLSTNRQVKRIDFPADVVLPTTYLNDVRFDLTRGAEGYAFVTDSSQNGPNGIVVIDLASGKSWRRLNDHPSTKADEKFVPTVEGKPFMARPPQGPDAYVKIGSDGIAVDAANDRLYYCPMAGRKIHSVAISALVDQGKSDEEVAATLKALPARDFASDGLECDGQGRLYLTDYEHNAIRRIDPKTEQAYAILVQDPRMIWPDSMSLGADGWLYFTANQLNRQPPYNKGKDLRKPPFAVFRVMTEGRPVGTR